MKIKNRKPKIAVVGAGPAGASAAIRLANFGFEVSLIEREKFPRHKLCGEFISPECLEHFRQIGVLTEILSAGGEWIKETVFYARDGKSVRIPSRWFAPDIEGALSLSRAEMDFQLLEKAKACGVNVLEESNVVGILSENEKLCGIKFRNKFRETRELSADILIDATGRARVLNKLAERNLPEKKIKTKPRTAKLIGFKTHLKNAHPQKEACEIYSFSNGYGGLSYVEKGFANHCFLIEPQVVKKFKGNADEIVEKVIFQNRRAAETLREASRSGDWLTVSIDGFGVKNPAPQPNLFSIGDAAAFIDPFTGSGMLMALESAEILAGVIRKNQFSTENISADYQHLHHLKFRKRLMICSMLRRFAFIPTFTSLMISALNFSEKPKKILVRATRPNAAQG